jgi:hypothetical protein
VKHPLTAEETYEHANRMFPDDGDLAAFNLIYEIRNGLLVPIDPDAIPDGEAKLIGMIGYLDLSDEYWIMQTLGQPDDADALMKEMEARILDLPDGDISEDEDVPSIERQFPTAIGAMGAWRTPDGATYFAFYRHPDVLPRHAHGVLKGVVAEAEAKRAGASAPSKAFVEN